MNDSPSHDGSGSALPHGERHVAVESGPTGGGGGTATSVSLGGVYTSSRAPSAGGLPRDPHPKQTETKRGKREVADHKSVNLWSVRDLRRWWPALSMCDMCHGIGGSVTPPSPLYKPRHSPKSIRSLRLL